MNDFNYYDLLLMQTAKHYDLSTENGRKKSNQDLADFFLAFHRRLKPDIAFEIGAFEALFSTNLKKNLPKTRAIAFEANPHNFAEFSAGIRDSGVEYIHSAISDKNGEIEFLVQQVIGDERVDSRRGNNSLLARTESNVQYEKIRVPSTTLKDFIQRNELKDRSFTAWVDVEGAARDVLEGGDGVWENCLAIMIEVEQFPYWKDQWLMWDVANFLMERKFVPIARDFEYEYQCNVVFLKQDLLRDAAIREGCALYHSYLAKKNPR